MTVTEVAIKRPILIIVAFLAIALMGIFCYVNLKYELFPSLTMPSVTIATAYSGASASEVESAVTKTIEEAVSGINKVKSVQAASQEGLSVVTVEFLQGADIELAMQATQRKVNQILAALPDGAKTPSLSTYSINDLPVMRLGVTSDMESKAFYQFLNDFIVPQLVKQPGVGQVSLIGGEQREIRINVDSRKLQIYGLSNVQVAEAIQKANLDYPTGKIKDHDGQYVLRLAGKLDSLDQLKNLIIGQSASGGEIVLSDVAEIRDGSKDQTTISRSNGKTTVGLLIQKQSDANQVEVCRAVRKALKILEEQNQAIRLKFDIISDGSQFIMDCSNAVIEDLGLAILLVALVMLLFLHSLRSSVMVMVAIPTSLVATFIGMWAFGFTLNMMTLLAMSLVIGILVDDSIVVLENIHHHLEQGAEQKVAALKGRNEIGFTALSITMVDVAVFLPLALVTGLIGGITRQFSLVVVISTLMSLLVSFTVTPMLASRFAKVESLSKSSLPGRFGIWFEAKYSALVAEYVKLLRWSLENRGKTLLVAGVLFVAAVALLPLGFIGSEFMPSMDRGELLVQIELPTRAKLEQTSQTTRQAEQILAEFPEVVKTFTTVGTASGMHAAAAPSNTAEIQVLLVPKKQRSRSTIEVSQALKGRLERIPGIKVHVSPITITGTADGAPIQLVISGTNWKSAYQAALRIQGIIGRIPGIDDLQLSAKEGQPEIRIEADREKMAKLGLNISDIGDVLETGFTGNDQSKFKDKDGNEYPIRVMYDSSDRSRTADVGGLTVLNNSGQPVQLSEFATLVNGTGPNKLERRDRNYAITLSAQAVGRASGDIGADIAKTLETVNMPSGVSYQFSGDLEQQDDAFGSLGLALLAGIIFIYLIMTALYNSFIDPFAVLFSVPLAIIGALLALGLTANSLSIFSIMGIIMQVGLVSKNAILLVDFANRARRSGAGMKEALLEAGQERIRPILMTTLTMILGMLPLALSNTPGSEFKHGLGWALIGGLTSSMAMTLIIVPVVYILVEQVRTFLSENLMNRRKKSPLGETSV
ncbi:HAE1 family hydrophobic/amphiphilic exporter-1 [Hydrogenispora ethanolica]|uniref:HAE1 family hydrophobic/amphiphilic exporter-1 n=1 Tax=Hydrogenispora ethanolica TaxID=1082276 RepID=A0A4R1R2W6_HYDET|nr:efflux RND transporter permease subunit [Hydrogenispora ethanolica]TCL59731.1 HAE1 family hydrophobic/amphiphilic exporter-1 [Hydrogenispora ethanolica]